MFDLGAAPHQSLYELRFKYGPVLWLQLGSINTPVIQSANAAAEFFKNHDLTFSDRKVPDSLTALDYNKGSLAIGNQKEHGKETGRTMKIVAEFVKERIQQRQVGMEKANKDFLDVLLDYEGDGKEGPDKLSERNVTIIILEMFFAGSETTSSTIEWAMAELLRGPGAMKNVKEEIDRVVPNRKVEESDIDRFALFAGGGKGNTPSTPCNSSTGPTEQWKIQTTWVTTSPRIHKSS
ncbi:unnamed protein product [Thlaspi arvense]|uniref:Cytochrome P450 n=1 Tax=Thlaspi arvense TaxID=13288 RepID=A0AAU9S247_THLAR|nr:unnamed protein product [Thlaspi arvense]